LSNDNVHSENELLSLIAEGDEGAFTQLFKSTVGHLSIYLGKILKDREALMEVLQETYIKIWLHRDKLKDVSYIKAYITKIAAHEAFNHLNKNARIVLVDPSNQLLTSQLSNDIEETITFKETYQLVQQAIDELPAQRRLIYRMSRLDGLKSHEIAEKLQLSPGYVRNSLSVAQQAIRDKLAASGKLILPVILLFQYFF